MPKNYRRNTDKPLYGEANALTIAAVGREHLNEVVREFKLPIMIQWTHLKTDMETLWDDGSLKEAVAYFSGRVKAMGRDTTREIIVPIAIRNGVLQDPALFKCSGEVEVFTKDALDRLFRVDQFPRPMLDREYIYAPPPEPGYGAPNRSLIDTYRNKTRSTEKK